MSEQTCTYGVEWKWLQDDVDTICFGKAGSRDHAPSCPVSDMKMNFRALYFGRVFCCQRKRAFEFSGLHSVLWEPIAPLDTPPMEAQHSILWLFICLQWCPCTFREGSLSDYVLLLLSTEARCTGIPLTYLSSFLNLINQKSEPLDFFKVGLFIILYILL